MNRARPTTDGSFCCLPLSSLRCIASLSVFSGGTRKKVFLESGLTLLRWSTDHLNGSRSRLPAKALSFAGKKADEQFWQISRSSASSVSTWWQKTAVSRLLPMAPGLTVSLTLPMFSHSEELQTQKLKSHLWRTQNLKILPLNRGVGQNIAVNAMLTGRDFFLTNFYPFGPLICIFSKASPKFFLF